MHALQKHGSMEEQELSQKQSKTQASKSLMHTEKTREGRLCHYIQTKIGNEKGEGSSTTYQSFEYGIATLSLKLGSK